MKFFDFLAITVLCCSISGIAWCIAWYNYSVERMYIENNYTKVVFPGRSNPTWVRFGAEADTPLPECLQPQTLVKEEAETEDTTEKKLFE